MHITALVNWPCINTPLLKAPCPQGEGTVVGADPDIPRYHSLEYSLAITLKLM